MQEPQDTPESAGPSRDDPAGPSPRARGRVRVTSCAGTCAALLLGLCFFLDWVRVDPALGTRFLDGVEKAIAEKGEKTPVDEHFLTIGHTLENQGALTGMDIIFWVRSAGAFGETIESARARAEDQHTQRILVIARLLLYALLLVAFLLAAYFLFHRFRRATAPILILCILVGATAVVLAGGLHYAYGLVQDAIGGSAQGVSPGPGAKVLLAGGALLSLAGVFGVTGRNFYRVYVGAGVTAAGLVLLGQRFLQTGSLP